MSWIEDRRQQLGDVKKEVTDRAIAVRDDAIKGAKGAAKDLQHVGQDVRDHAIELIPGAIAAIGLIEEERAKRNGVPFLEQVMRDIEGGADFFMRRQRNAPPTEGNKPTLPPPPAK